METWGIVLSAGAVVAVIETVKELILWRKTRKAQIEDKSAEKLDRQYNAADQIEELRAETSEQFDQVNERFEKVETKIDTVEANTYAVAMSSKAQAYDRIRYLGLTYIKTGWITEEELHNIIDMHNAYKLLGGDGFLDRIMVEVNSLPLRHTIDER